MKTKILLIAILAGTLWITSCTKYPGDVERTQEDLAVLSKWETSNFPTSGTFYLADSVYYKDGNDSGYVNGGKALEIVARIAKNLTDRGYIRVGKSTKSDLLIAVTYIKNTNVDVYYPYYPYWGYWGGGYYYPYYGYGYPYVTSYSVGTVITDMFDMSKAPGNIVGIYTGIIRGLYTETHTTSDVNNSIDQMFNQSSCFPTLN
jgi:hypothetical protein